MSLAYPSYPSYRSNFTAPMPMQGNGGLGAGGSPEVIGLDELGASENALPLDPQPTLLAAGT